MHEELPHNNAVHDADGVSIHAGFPNPAADKSLQTLDFNQLLIQHGASTYIFRIRGNEWESVGVFDNDIAVIDRVLDPRANDVTIWWNDARGEFSLSQYGSMPQGASCWGVVTSTIHQLRQPPQPKPKKSGRPQQSKTEGQGQDSRQSQEHPHAQP